MANDNDNGNDNNKKGLGGLFKKAGEVFSKKKNSEDDGIAQTDGTNESDIKSGYDEQELEHDQETTEEFEPAFNRLDDIEDNDQTAPIVEADTTKPSFQIADFASDDEEDEEIEQTLKSIQLPSANEGSGLNKVKSSLSSLFKKQPPSPIHEPTKKRKVKSGPSLWRKIRKKLRSSSSSSESKSFTQYYQELFSPNNRPAIHRNFILLLFVCGAFLSARLLTTVITPKPTFDKVNVANVSPYEQTSNLSNSLASLEKNDLFKAEVVIPTQKPVKKKEPVVDEKLVCKEASRKSNLGVKLVKTIVLQDSVKSIASVQVRGKDDHLRIGDRIDGMAEIGHIDGGKLIFKNLKSGLCEYVESPKQDNGKRKTFNVEKNLNKAKKLISDSKKTGIKNEGNTYKIKKSVRDELLGDISSIITQARAIPIKNPDGTYCFRMVEIVADSIYTKLGVQNQDIICNINGRKMESLNEAMGLMGKLKTNDRFELGIKRNGTEQTFDYNFED